MAMVRAAMVNSTRMWSRIAQADDFAGEEIEHDGQIEPPFLGWHLGDVGEPNLIGPLGGEFLVEPVGGDRQIVMAVGGAYPEPPWRYCPDALVTHEQGAIGRLARTFGPATPIPRRRDVQHIAHDSNRECLALIRDEAEFHLGASENAAFFLESPA